MPCGSPPKLGQALGHELPLGSVLVIADQRLAEDLAMLRLRRAPVLGGADAQAADDVVG